MKIENKLIVINYWHGKNIYCRNVLDHLAKIKLKFPNESVRMFALNPFENETFIEDFNHLNDWIEYMKDQTGTYLFYQITRFPSILILTTDGRIIFRQDGIKTNHIKHIEYFLKSFYLSNDLVNNITEQETPSL
ncbi:MAG TPA: hypothetical protein VGF79_03950 [Bacteroidia bacterium]